MATISELFPIDTTAISGVTISETEAQFLANTTTAGTVVASACLVVDANRDIATIRNITSDGDFTTTGTIEGTIITDGTASITGGVATGLTATNMILNGTLSGTAVTATIDTSSTTVPRTGSIKSYADTQDAATLVSANNYANTQDDSHSTADRAYADTQDDVHSTADRAYTDAQVAAVSGSSWALRTLDTSGGTLDIAEFLAIASGASRMELLIEGVSHDFAFSTLMYLSIGDSTSYTSNISLGSYTFGNIINARFTFLKNDLDKWYIRGDSDGAIAEFDVDRTLTSELTRLRLQLSNAAADFDAGKLNLWIYS